MARRVHKQRASTSRRGRIVATPVLLAALVVLLLVGAVGVAVGSAALRSARAARDDMVQLALPSKSPAAITAALAVGTVEVPPLDGLELAEAETVLSAAGLSVQTKSLGNSERKGTVDVVAVQTPAAGTLVDVGSLVTLTMESVAGTSSAQPAGGSGDKRRAFVVCIDPGHQGRSDSSPEPVGPRSKKMKERARGGATGISTEVPEYEIALQISMNLKERLEAQGVKVVMTRTTNDVNISNAERARKANKSDADLFVRVHGNGSPDPDECGVSVLYPATNRWTEPIAARSKRASGLVCSALVAQTGSVDRGIKPASGHAGFNWSTVPAVLVECGFLSNSVEDRLLASPYYQDKVAKGISHGAMAYLIAEEAR